MTLFNATPENCARSRGTGGGSRTHVNPVIGKELPLTDAGKGHVAVMESGAYGKIVLVP